MFSFISRRINLHKYAISNEFSRSTSPYFTDSVGHIFGDTQQISRVRDMAKKMNAMGFITKYKHQETEMNLDFVIEMSILSKKLNVISHISDAFDSIGERIYLYLMKRRIVKKIDTIVGENWLPRFFPATSRRRMIYDAVVGSYSKDITDTWSAYTVSPMIVPEHKATLFDYWMLARHGYYINDSYMCERIAVSCDNILYPSLNSSNMTARIENLNKAVSHFTKQDGTY